MKIELNSDSILSRCGFEVIFGEFDLLRFPEVAENMLFLLQNFSVLWH